MLDSKNPQRWIVNLEGMTVDAIYIIIVLCASASSPDGVKVGLLSYGSTIFGVYLEK